MTISATTLGDNIERPSNAEYIYNPDQLIAGAFPIVTDNATLLAGSSGQIVKRGTVVGQITNGTATSAAKSGGNTGVGTFTIDGTAPVQANATSGVYKLRVLATGRAQLLDPKGASLGEYDYTSGGSVTIIDRIKGVLADDASTHFAVGDGFDITVAAGSGKYITSVATAVDGSAVPVGIVVDDTDITADATAGIYKTGEFNANAITIDASWSTTTVQTALRPSSIFIKTNVLSAADPT